MRCRDYYSPIFSGLLMLLSQQAKKVPLCQQGCLIPITRRKLRCHHTIVVKTTVSITQGIHWGTSCSPTVLFNGKLGKPKIGFSQLPYDPAIPLLGIYPEKTLIQNYYIHPNFIAEQFTITKTWKQPKCPSTD